jgi:DNA polymerase II small subunit
VQEAGPEVRSAISRLLDAGFQISPETLKMLQEHENPTHIVDEFLINKQVRPQEITILEPKHFFHSNKEDTVERKQLMDIVTEPQHPLKEKTITAQDMKDDIVIIKDPTQELKSKGTIEDFLSNFQDRYYRLRDVISHRIDGKGIIDIQDATGSAVKDKRSHNATVKIVGLVTSKTYTKGGNIVLNLEDPTGQIMAIVTQKDQGIMQKATFILHDQVVCVEGTNVSSEMLIVKDLFLPDIPANRRKNYAKEEVSAILISDIHYGSKQFLNGIFQDFLKWLQGREGTDDQIELAKTVKYLVIAGDLVDGIGVYPNQINEINIYDLDKQYAGLAKLLQDVPDYIHIIISPGNHDGVRTAIPRPAIDKRFIEPFGETGLKISSLGCPCQVTLHGVNLLIYHGDSILDIVGALSKPEQEANFVAMREMLRGRHLAPIYGKGTSIVQEPRDWLVIDQVPDILHCGHVHVNSFGSYRNTLIINSGTFQGQTEYQKTIGIEPTPGIVPLVNLRTLEVKSLKFS